MDQFRVWLPDNSKTDPRVNSLRLLFRGLHAFRSYYESDGESEITAPNGSIWSIFDIEYLYSMAMRKPARIIPPDILAADLPIGNYIQYSGSWSRIVVKEVTGTMPMVAIQLADQKIKKCRADALISTMSPAQKKLLDYDKAHPCLPLRQQQAIELFLVLNMPEKDAAIAMGLTQTNPVGMYATSGLTRLLKMMDSGQINRFQDSTQQMLMVG